MLFILNRILNYFRIAGIFAWSMICITLAILMIPITWGRGFSVSMARWLYSPGIILLAGASLKVEGEENISSNETYIFLSNHQSFMDIPILFRGIPNRLHFVAKKGIKYVPFIGWYMLAMGMIFIDRRLKGNQSMKSLKKAGALIRRGRSVILFPEGTRSAEGEITPFKKGAFILALEAMVKVVPVALVGTGQLLPRGSGIFHPSTLSLAIGKPIDSRKYKKDRQGLAQEVEKQMRRLYDSAKN